MELIKIIKKGTITANIYNNSTSENPRNFENITEMVFFSNTYDIGDTHNYDSLEDFFNKAKEKLEIQTNNINEIIKIAKDNNWLILPVYGYSHGDLDISLNKFNCKWDSGLLGIIHMTAEQIKNNNITLETAYRYIESDINIYRDYLNNDVYLMEITDITNNIFEELSIDFYLSEYKNFNDMIKNMLKDVGYEKILNKKYVNIEKKDKYIELNNLINKLKKDKTNFDFYEMTVVNRTTCFRFYAKDNKQIQKILEQYKFKFYFAKNNNFIAFNRQDKILIIFNDNKILIYLYKEYENFSDNVTYSRDLLKTL